jgi:hypothetical protein
MIRMVTTMLGVVAVLTACGGYQTGTPTTVSSVGQPQSASSRCEAFRQSELAGDPVTLVAAYESTALEISEWLESGKIPGGGRAGAGKAPTRSLPLTLIIASCYFDGSFTFRGPLPRGAEPPHAERMLFLLDGAGSPIASIGGTRQLYPLVRPAP